MLTLTPYLLCKSSPLYYYFLTLFYFYLSSCLLFLSVLPSSFFDPLILSFLHSVNFLAQALYSLVVSLAVATPQSLLDFHSKALTQQ